MIDTIDAVPEGKAFFPKVLYSNEELLKTARWSPAVLVLLFFLNVSLIAAPFFMARAKTKPADIYDYMPGIGAALSALYDLDLACAVEDGVFACTETYLVPLDAGMYDVYVLPQTVAEIDDVSRIVFGRTAVAFFYEAPDDKDDYVLSGSYALLDGMDFDAIDREALGFGSMTDEEFDSYLNATVIGALLSSELPADLATLYLAQLVQTALYVLVMSLLLMAANIRRATKKIRYRTSFSYVVAAITGPALLACVVGLVWSVGGTIVWSAAYAVRMILLYTKINNRAGTF